MANITHGMNIAEVQKISTQLKARASDLRGMRAEVDGLVGQSLQQWKGPDSGKFSSLWKGTYRVATQKLVEDLEELARIAYENAKGQERVSDTLEGAGGGDGAGVRGGDGGESNSHQKNPLQHARDLLDLAQAAYSDGKVPAGYIKLTRSELSKLGINEIDLHNPYTGFDADIYQREDGRLVVTFRGTTDLKDWGNNIPAFKGGFGWQDWNSISLAKKLNEGMKAQGMDPGNVSYTGHSLGGRNAVTAGLVTGNETLSVNGFPVSLRARVLAEGFKVEGARNEKMYLIDDSADVVSKLNLNFLPKDRAQRIVVNLGEKNGLGDQLNILKNHEVETVKKGLKKATTTSN